MIIEAKSEGDNFVAGEYLICMRDFALSNHISVKRLLKNTGQDINFLLNPPAKINIQVMSIISSNLFNGLPNPILASIEFGKSMAMSSHGALGLAIQGCKTLHDAAILVQHYFQTRASARAIDLVNESSHSYLRLPQCEPTHSNTAALNTRYYTDFSTLINIHGLVLKILNHHVLQGQCIINVTRPEPLNFPFVQLPKNVKVLFNCQYYQLGIPNHWLQLQLKIGDLELAQFAEDECKLTLKQLSPKDLIDQIYKVLDSGGTNHVSLQEMAAFMLMSTSTLQRRLKELDTTFQQIKSMVRINQAKALLKHTNQTLDIIADALGYSDASNFSKSFKAQTGLTPKGYRLLTN
jgi:AraC-like DNA-binding protein